MKHNASETPSTAVAVTDAGEVDQGFVILETNYKLYAYTGKKKKNVYIQFIYFFLLQIHHFKLQY